MQRYRPGGQIAEVAADIRREAETGTAGADSHGPREEAELLTRLERSKRRWVTALTRAAR